MKTGDEVDAMCDVWGQGYEVGLREGLEEEVEQIGWITNESLFRLRHGGNHEGVVPVHRKQSVFAKTPIFRTKNMDVSEVYARNTKRWVSKNAEGMWVVGEGDNEIALCKRRQDAFILKQVAGEE